MVLFNILSWSLGHQSAFHLFPGCTKFRKFNKRGGLGHPRALCQNKQGLAQGCRGPIPGQTLPFAK